MGVVNLLPRNSKLYWLEYNFSVWTRFPLKTQFWCPFNQLMLPYHALSSSSNPDCRLVLQQIKLLYGLQSWASARLPPSFGLRRSYRAAGIPCYSLSTITASCCSNEPSGTTYDIGRAASSATTCTGEHKQSRPPKPTRQQRVRQYLT